MLAAALTLALLSPLVGEVLFGAVPLSRLPFGLLGLIGLYGGGAMLVREIVRRRRLSSPWLVWLGLAYGLFEEGPVVQSIFDQHYRGLSFLGYYGHWVGVNWIWALFIVPYHAVFSIAIPIAVAELIFPDRRDQAWLDTGGLLLAATAFVGNAVLLAIFHTGLFSARAPDVSLGANVGALVVIAAIVAAAFHAGPRTVIAATGSLPAASPRRLRTIGLVSGLAWFVGFRVLVIGTGTNVSAPVALGSGLALAILIAWRTLHWSADGRAWTTESTYALVAGALPTCWLMGFLVAAISGGNPIVNLAGQVIFGAVMFSGLRRLRRRVVGSSQLS
jgi:hypothetical protein